MVYTMHELAIKELENQIRILKLKMPSIDESIKTYAQMTKNYEKERADMIIKIAEYEAAIEHLKGENE